MAVSAIAFSTASLGAEPLNREPARLLETDRRNEPTQFENLSGRPTHRITEGLRWRFTSERQEWPDRVDNEKAEAPLAKVDEGEIRATLIGHSTVLLQVNGLNILTDPIWSDRAGPRSWLGVKRVRPPAIPFDLLPPIDIVLVSHNHYDHLDRPTLLRLAQRDDPLILAGLNVGKVIPSNRVVEFAWWHGLDVGNGVRISFVPAEHFSRRGLFDQNTTLWGGFVLQTGAGSIYFAGDTAMGSHFAEIRERFGPMALSLLPIGAYEPRWFLSQAHINPAEAVHASRILQSRLSLGIHFGTFQLSEEAIDAPQRDLTQALAELGEHMDFRTPRFGEAVLIRQEPTTPKRHSTALPR